MYIIYFTRHDKGGLKMDTHNYHNPIITKDWLNARNIDYKIENPEQLIQLINRLVETGDFKFALLAHRILLSALHDIDIVLWDRQINRGIALAKQMLSEKNPQKTIEMIINHGIGLL